MMMTLLLSGGLDWERDGRDWPHRDHSRFIRAGNVRWHYQEFGKKGPVVLLVHGTGASTHSWRAVAPLLAKHFRVIVPDLPGHGFTTIVSEDRLSLRGMAHAVDQLLHHVDVRPALAAGHSAGAAILIRMCLDQQIAPKGLISFNGALLPFDGFAGQLFPMMANILFLNPFTPRFFAWSAGDRSRVERLIRDTGSTIDAQGIDFYQRLFTSPRHVASALGMMASWDLKPLLRDLPALKTPLLLVAGANDRAVPPETARRIKERLPAADVRELADLGHLAHEERPDLAAEIIVELARRVGVLPPG